MNNAQNREQSISDVIRLRQDRLSLRQGYASLLRTVIVLALAGYILFTQFFLITQTSGKGMFPALKDGDLAIVFRMQQEYARDDIVTYQVDGTRYFGRVVAAEHDVVTIDESGTMSVNGTPQSGEILYPTYSKGDTEYPYRVPAGCLYVLGDYRTQTKDSRDFGPISLEDVEGKVITILRRRGL